VDLLGMLLKATPRRVDFSNIPSKSTRLGVANTIYMITINLAEPWNIMESFKKWLDLLTQANQKVLASLSEEERERLKKISLTIFNFFLIPP